MSRFEWDRLIDVENTARELTKDFTIFHLFKASFVDWKNSFDVFCLIAICLIVASAFSYGIEKPLITRKIVVYWISFILIVFMCQSYWIIFLRSPFFRYFDGADGSKYLDYVSDKNESIQFKQSQMKLRMIKYRDWCDKNMHQYGEFCKSSLFEGITFEELNSSINILLAPKIEKR